MNFSIPDHKAIRKAFAEGEEAVVTLFDSVTVQVEELAAQLEKQAGMLKDLQARLSKNSRNSGKPPSSDGYNKPNRTNSLRKPGQKPNGGQPGHKGHTLERSETPDHTATHKPDECTNCRTSLEDVSAVGEEERQVYDIPAIRIEVTAHRAEIKICPGCGTENRGEFPESVKRGVRYGTGVKTWAAYFGNQHHIPLERTAQIIEDLTGHGISEGSLLKASEELSECVRPSTEATAELLRNAEVLNADETGLRVKGKLHWLHVASSDLLTHYNVHEKRGKEAMDAAGILSEFKGKMVHDHLKSYFGYKKCRHGLCNSHHLRELEFIGKQYEQAWTGDMADLLLEIKEAVEKLKPDRDSFGSEEIENFERRYDEIVCRGFADNPFTPPKEKKRGRVKKTPPLNLLTRLRDYKAETLAFMYDFRVPFDNNAAERDVRMMKVKQKVSGCFRTFEGAERFACIRGYISTARKNSQNIFEAIRDAFLGNPFIPDAAA
ncbi:MAG: IS66 family transposase [Candidatus Electrothrix sp. Rat3]|nr:IS66 family transposase [Candidatus Electrothrix rattekaaiensis]MDU9050942.1 IS66 family transposase [Candidatus Electrothrix rattekaaiensis]